MRKSPRRRRLSEVLPRDLRDAARDAYEIQCQGNGNMKGQNGACLQGISYYERVARRKYEGIITLSMQSNRIVKVALRMCSLSRKGEQKSVCQAGAFAVHNEVKKRIEESHP